MDAELMKGSLESKMDEMDYRRNKCSYQSQTQTWI